MSDGVNIETLLRSLDDGPQWPCKQAAFTLRGCLDDAELGYACRELGIETVEQLKAKVQPDPRVAELSGYITVLLDLATDAANGLEYVRDVHGDLYGVGFDRVKIKAEVLPVIRLKMTQLISAPRGEG